MGEGEEEEDGREGGEPWGKADRIAPAGEGGWRSWWTVRWLSRTLPLPLSPVSTLPTRVGWGGEAYIWVEDHVLDSVAVEK